jgi:hypothetical protein
VGFAATVADKLPANVDERRVGHGRRVVFVQQGLDVLLLCGDLVSSEAQIKPACLELPANPKPRQIAVTNSLVTRITPRSSTP